MFGTKPCMKFITRLCTSSYSVVDIALRQVVRLMQPCLYCKVPFHCGQSNDYFDGHAVERSSQFWPIDGAVAIKDQRENVIFR